MNTAQHLDEVFLADIERRIKEVQSQSDDQQRAANLAELADELQHRSMNYMQPPLVDRFHQLWWKIVLTDEQRVIVLVSWRIWYTMEVARIDAGLYDAVEDIPYIAETKAALEELNGLLEMLRLSIVSHHQAETPDTEPLLLDVPVTTLARCVEALRRSRFIKPNESTASIVSRLWSTRSNTKNREATYNATRANLRASQANDERITTLILALAYEMPPEQIQELATVFAGIARGQTPPAWSQYTK